MVIGIDASRAFLKQRTGIEEYSYQVIQHLRDALPAEAEVILYVRKKLQWKAGRCSAVLPEIDFPLPLHWQVKGLWAPRFWTQVRLSLEMLFHAPDVLWIPAHTVPIIHPRKTLVTVHGLEYEFSPESYRFWERIYMRCSIRYSVWAAETVIAVSENTKRDLMRLYGIASEKVQVVYEGFSRPKILESSAEARPQAIPYFFFVGRLETRKNIVRLIEAFDLFKAKMGLPHQLILAGKPGYGYEIIKKQISESKYQSAIQELGYVTEKEKWMWLQKAEVFLFPSLYEGFGLPVIEAQSVGVPVITSNTSSLPEIVGDGAILVDPTSVEEIARAMETVVQDRELRADIIEKATHNVGRYSWARCAQEVSGLFAPVEVGQSGQDEY